MMIFFMGEKKRVSEFLSCQKTQFHLNFVLAASLCSPVTIVHYLSRNL